VHSVAVGTCDIQVSGSSINKHLFGAVCDPSKWKFSFFSSCSM